MIKNKVIVLGEDGNNTLGLVRSLGQRGLYVILLLRASGKGKSGRSRYVRKLHLLDEFEDGIGVLINEYSGDEVCPIVYPAGDHEVSLLDENYDRLKDHFILFNVKRRQGEINKYLNKIMTFPLAERNGLRLIKTWEISNSNQIPDGITYPCIIKSTNSKQHNKEVMFVCDSFKQLKENVREGVDYLLQEYIQRDHELCLVGIAFDEGRNVYLPAAVRKIGDGLGAKQSVFIRLDDIHDYPNLNVEGISSFVRDIGYEGIFSVEVLYFRGAYYFLEINLRNDGCCYLYTKAGINYPYLWALHSAGMLNEEELRTGGFRTPLYLMSANYLFYLKAREVSIWQFCANFFKARAFYVMSIDDPWPFIVSVSARVSRVARRFLRKMFS